MDVSVYQAKARLSELLAAVEAGEEVVITRYGKRVAKLVAVTKTAQKRKLGGLRGKIRVSDDFDAPLPDDVLASFEGSLEGDE